MRFRPFVLIAIAAFAASVSVGRAQSQDAKPQPKTEATLAGKWNVSVESPNGTVEAMLDMKLDGKKVSGTIASQMGEARIDGEFADGKLAFTFTMDANGQSMNVAVKGVQQKDGTLAGTLDYGQGDVPWKAARAK